MLSSVLILIELSNVFITIVPTVLLNIYGINNENLKFVFSLVITSFSIIIDMYEYVILYNVYIFIMINTIIIYTEIHIMINIYMCLFYVFKDKSKGTNNCVYLDCCDNCYDCLYCKCCNLLCFDESTMV